MYAIIRTGGRQYRAEVGETIDVERLPHDEGQTIEIEEVLLVASEDGDLVVGQPLVDGASVTATVVSQYRDKKILVWKYKPKKRYRRRRGHRQYYTRLQIEAINY
ncbi:MAG: 50S ribosomal protein L21 [Chloroflexi bacterium]|nr:50S ribosomal protein L21 [Chloroflexota bacterium]